MLTGWEDGDKDPWLLLTDLPPATFLLVLLRRRVGRSTRQQRISTLVAPTAPTAVDKGE